MFWKRLNDSGQETQMLELLMRVGVAGCFIGHGAFGVMGKEAWLPYFAVAGIGPDLARALMPIVGSIDIAIGISALLTPRPAVLAYAAGWSVWTALLRPLAGESPFETLERAGNYGLPIAFLLLAGVGWRPTVDWLREVRVAEPTADRRRRVGIALRTTIAALLVGHGGLAFLGKPLLESHLAAIGLPHGSLALLGALELAMAATVAVRPTPGLLLGVVVWKVGTEALYPISGDPFWEFVERAGSYAAPLALWAMVRDPARATVTTRARTVMSILFLGVATPALAVAAPVLHAGIASHTAAVSVTSAQETPLLSKLRRGGLVLACRHGITDRSRGDARRVDFDDPSTQRVLSPEGRRQARRLGEIIRRQRVPIGQVLTSPYARAAESAELAFGAADTHSALYGGDPEKRRGLRRLLTAEPTDATNRVLMTHQGVLYGAMPRLPRGSIREGDCMVLQPDGRDFQILARLGPDEWDALDVEPSPTTSESGRAIAAAREGGTVIVCRHAVTGSFPEREPVDYADSTTQRLLNRAGERQSRTLGTAITALGIEVSELVASPMNRARRTAELMFERPVTIDSVWHTNGGSYGGAARAQRRNVLATPVERGNRLIVSHIGTMETVLDGIRGRVGEGDCVVVRPRGTGYDVIGVVEAEGWSGRLDAG